MTEELVGMIIANNLEENNTEKLLIDKPVNTPDTPDTPDTPSDLLIDSNETNELIKDELIKSILLRVIVDNDELKKLNIDMDEKTKEIVKSLLSSNPKFFNELNDSFSNLIKENNIDLSDIPVIMDLLKKLFEILHNLKNKILNSNDIADITSNVFKFVINVLISESNLGEEFKTNIEKFIDSSIALIKLVNLLKLDKTGCLFNFLTKK
jgi:ATP-dependent Lon protease